MTTFVLVPGYWLGAWAWQDVTDALRADGHEVHPVTLTGMAERAAEAGPDTDLDTHIADIVAVIEDNDLADVVLVAHSYGGCPVTGVADRIPDRLARIIYVDSGPLPDGMAQGDMGGPEGRAYLESLVVDGWRVPLPSWEDVANTMGSSLEGLDEAALARFREGATDQPLGTITQPIRLTGRGDDLPCDLIACSFPLPVVREMIASGHPFFAALAGPQWRLFELPTGHWPMFSRPADLARSLVELAA
ncbi:alpha/beta hydrolase [Longispora sp. K20-0274]|uniref:alpha/beta fold hydrolase n=1 Tax=Longispora sp. K20-0274 TaxID=3088255 RepID=UPI003999E14C